MDDIDTAFKCETTDSAARIIDRHRQLFDVPIEREAPDCFCKTTHTARCIYSLIRIIVKGRET